MRIFLICLTAVLLRADPYPDDVQRIKLSVDRQEGSAWKPVDSALVFAAGDKLRFRVSSTFAGYLYVMNHGTSGAYELLFPRADTGADNSIEAGKEYIVPAVQGWFKVTGPAGHDIVYWVISPIKLGNEVRPLPPPPPTASLPLSFRPRCDDAIFKSRGDCVDTSAGVKPLKEGEAIPKNLSGLAEPTPRELLFIQEKGATVVSSPAPLTGPVVYELRLAHR
ncbi:MAG TPA: DUF4384 domain-containing protein [Bryobacteraceae bacterium]|jgi:hypothetical protein|nr:DUF4384 domain-containing protein [Bryobacteraceae bacterium]